MTPGSSTGTCHRHKLVIALATFILAAALHTLPALAAIPPVNYWGNVYIDDEFAPIGTTVILTIGDQGTVETTTINQIGYYDVDVPMDDPYTVDDEGFTPADVSFTVDGIMTTVPVPEPLEGSSVNLQSHHKSRV